MKSFEEVFADLQSLADPDGRARWEKAYGSAENFLGIGFTKIRSFAKEVKRDHERALQLWDTGVLDARFLSVLTEEPKKITPVQAETQTSQINFALLARMYGEEIWAALPFGTEYLPVYFRHENPFYRSTACGMLTRLAEKSKTLSDTFFEPYLQTIEENILTEDNWVKESMINVMIKVGSCSEPLRQSVLAICGRTGYVEVDYGMTSCQTPDPVKILSSERAINKAAAKK